MQPPRRTESGLFHAESAGGESGVAATRLVTHSGACRLKLKVSAGRATLTPWRYTLTLS